MKPDVHYIRRLEVGDTFENSRGEKCEVVEVQRDGTIEAATKGSGDRYLRIYDNRGNGTPSSGRIKTP
jgi:hypothetical protein